MMMNQASKNSLFIGDLAIFCTDEDLYSAFCQFGEILEIKIMKSEETSRNLSYGFIKFQHARSASEAMRCLNGVLLCGRPMRINWATYKSKITTVKEAVKGEDLGTSPVHVSFISYQTARLVTEESLRTLFGKYGMVTDVSIKKSMIDKEIGRQSGYGFVHYQLTQDGIRAAVKAVEELTDTTLDDVNYKSSLSHTLTKFLTGEAIAPLTVNEPVTVGTGFASSSATASSTTTTASSAPIAVVPEQPSWMLHQAQAQAQAQAQQQAAQQQYQNQQQLAYLQLQQQQQLIQQQMSTLLFQAQQQQQQQQMMNNSNNNANGGSKILSLVQQHQQQQQQNLQRSLGMFGNTNGFGGGYSNPTPDLLGFNDNNSNLLNGLEHHLNMNASPFTPMAQQQQHQQLMGNLGLGLNNLNLSSPQLPLSMQMPSLQMSSLQMPSLQMPMPLLQPMNNNHGNGMMGLPAMNMSNSMPGMNLAMPPPPAPMNIPAPMNMSAINIPMPITVPLMQQAVQQQVQSQAVQQQQAHAQQQQVASPQVSYSNFSPGGALPRWIASPSMTDSYVNNLLYSPGHIYQLSPGNNGKTTTSGLSSPLVPAAALMGNGNMHVPLIMQQLQSPPQYLRQSPLQPMTQSPQQQQQGSGGGTGSLTASPMSFNRDIVQSREAVRSSTAMRKGARSMSSLLRKTLHTETTADGSGNGTGMAEDKGAGGTETGESGNPAKSPGKAVEAVATGTAAGVTAVTTH